MKKTVILLIASYSWLNMQAQTTKDTLARTGLTDTEFHNAVNAYLRMTEKATYKAFKKATLKMGDKLNQKVAPEELAKEEDWNKWIAANWKKPKFISIDEANNARNIGLELTKKQYEENKELYQMMRKATFEQWLEIIKPERASSPF